MLKLIIKVGLLNLALFLPFTAYATEVQKKDESALAHMELASSYFQAGRTDVALDEIQKILNTDPNNSMANELLGLIYMKRGQLAEAEVKLKLATISDTTNSSAFSNYGMLLCKMSKYDEGMTAFGKSLLSSRNSRPSTTLVNASICLQQKGDQTGAEKFLLKALEQEPFMPAALYQLSRVYFATQKYDLAESRLIALHKQTEPNASSLYLSYLINSAQGKTSQAKTIETLLKTRFSDSPEVQLLKAN